jgi:hypothetical protein
VDDLVASFFATSLATNDRTPSQWRSFTPPAGRVNTFRPAFLCNRLDTLAARLEDGCSERLHGSRMARDVEMPMVGSLDATYRELSTRRALAQDGSPYVTRQMSSLR